MRIVHVSPYDHQISGGVREHVVNLASHQRGFGHDVTILAPASLTAGLAPDVVCVSTGVVPVRGAGSIARIALSPSVPGRVGRILDTGKFDIVHIHEPLVPMVSISALVRSKAVTIGTIHGYRPSFAPYRVFNQPLRRLMARLSARVAVSEDAKAWASRYFPGPYHVIPNGVDLERFGGPRVEPVGAFDDGRPNLLFVGRLEPRKGCRHLLDAMPRIKAAIPDTRLLVVGHYSEKIRRQWQRLAALRGLTANDVVFVGYVPAADLPNYYRSATVFCAPSTGFEALGIVLLEAMASGTPIVTSDIAGYRTVVTHGQEALVVPPRDSKCLADAIVALLQQPQLRRKMGIAGRARAQQYGWQRVAQDLLELYRMCLR
jgi:phosphatidylinositol alpha-mannosyltransferase